MKFMKKLSPLALATSVALGGMVAVPSVASADTSASFSIANMYLWRGQNLTQDGAAASGSLDYSHDSCAYAGVWTTTETGGTETDFYAGFAGEVSDFSYDISYWYYMYPEDDTNTDYDENNLSEVVLGLGYGPVTLTAYVSDETQGASDYTYLTFDYELDKFNFQYGMWDYDEAGNNEYSHITVMYAATDELTFGVTKADNDVADDATGAVEVDPMFYVSYSKSFDL
ncbi:TorF family putative porin [Thiohalophilus sp.]|uniref:TorF family putative porin n=1 Tax=Thiohalophilus sp. TaxID=3028392 RepID=UPI0039751148